MTVNPLFNAMIIGFHGQEALARMIASQLKDKVAFAEIDRYAAGEMVVFPPKINGGDVIVVADLQEDPASFMSHLLLADVLKRLGAKRLTLIAPWIAYGRQDKIDKHGSAPAGLVVAQQLSGYYQRIVTLDAHSPVFMDAFGRTLKNILPDAQMIPSKLLDRAEVIVAPDAGAEERAKRIAKQAKKPFVVCTKERLKDRVRTKVAQNDLVAGKRVLIIDDMSDTGGTLIGASRALYEANAAQVDAFVCHTFDLDLLKKRIQKEINEIEVAYNHAEKLENFFLLSQLISFSH